MEVGLMEQWANVCATILDRSGNATSTKLMQMQNIAANKSVQTEHGMKVKKISAHVMRDRTMFIVTQMNQQQQELRVGASQDVCLWLIPGGMRNGGDANVQTPQNIMMQHRNSVQTVGLNGWLLLAQVQQGDYFYILRNYSYF